MARLFRFVIYLIVALLALVFALLNAEPVQFNYYYGQVPAPLSLIVAIGIAIGAVLGLVASLGIVIKTKRQSTVNRRHADIAEKELAKLRALPLKENS